jgi:hypothetical protein
MRVQRKTGARLAIAAGNAAIDERLRHLEARVSCGRQVAAVPHGRRLAA